jgi:hypothetical protein
VIVAFVPVSSVPTLHVTVVVPVHVPCVEVADVAVMPAGNTSVTMVFTAVDGPLFVTTIVKMIAPPGATLVAFAVLRMLTSVGPGLAAVATVELLLAGVGSVVAVVIVAVLLIPPIATWGTATTMSNVADPPAAKSASVQFTGPVPPTAGAAQMNAGPLVCVKDTNVVPAGVVSLIATVVASDGPAFVAVSVYVMLLPETTVAGPDFTIATSAD